MMNNWKHFELYPDFKNITTPDGKPSDLDMFYLTDTNFLIIGEFKNGDMGSLGEKQKSMFETFIDDYKNGGIIIYATHHNTIEDGSKRYDAANCEVEKYYLKGRWHTPKKYTNVQDVFDKYCEVKKMNIECEKERKIYKHIKDDKTFYSIGLYKKQQDGTYLNGYMSCRFSNNADVPDKSKIKIKEAWLDFYVKDKKTIPLIFINKFEIIEQTDKDIPQNIKTDYDDSGIQLKDEELPF